MIDGVLATFFSKFGFVAGYVDSVIKSWGYAVSAGDISGSAALTLSGRISNSPSTALVPIWAGNAAYSWQTGDQTLRVASTDADDDGAPGGNGARTVRITWLDSTGTQFTTDVTMDGVNLVDSAAITARRVNRVEVLTAGTSETNEGVITVYASDGATPLAVMPVGAGVSDTSIQTVPASKRDVITIINCESEQVTGSVSIALMARASGGQWAPIQYFMMRHDGRSSLKYPVAMPAGTDYYFGISDVAGEYCFVSATGWRESI